jgi:hypothetical protein
MGCRELNGVTQNFADRQTSFPELQQHFFKSVGVLEHL